MNKVEHITMIIKGWIIILKTFFKWKAYSHSKWRLDTMNSFFFFFLLYRATPMAYRSSRLGLNQSCSHQPMLQTQQRQIWAASVTYATAHSNAISLTHWSRPGIEPASSWMLVRFVSTEPWWELCLDLSLCGLCRIFWGLRDNESIKYIKSDFQSWWWRERRMVLKAVEWNHAPFSG